VVASQRTVRKLGKVLSFRLSYLQRLLSGEKTTTIRKGIVQPLHQEVFLESNGRIYGEAQVKSLRFTRVSELTDEDAKKDGFGSKKDLLDALREIYPDLTDDDWVTIISLDNITRYSSPIKAEELETLSATDYSLVARLALAHGLAETREQRAVLAKLALGRTLQEVANELKVPEAKIKAFIRECALKLRERGALK